MAGIYMEIVFRILDRDFKRSQRAEQHLLAGMKKYGITGKVFQVFEILEFSRMGLTQLPALEMNGVLLHQGIVLDEVLADDVCSRLSMALEKTKNKS